MAAVYSTMIQAPRAGEYSAIVTADFEDGSQIQSRPVIVTIKGRNGGVIAVVLILAALGAGFGLIALVLGFTSKSRACRAFTALWLVCMLSWIVWVPAGTGNF